MNAPLRIGVTQYAALLDEVAAMVAARQPLVPGLLTLESRQLGRVGRAAGLLRSQLQQGSSVDDALQTLDARLGPQLSAAFRIAAERGDAVPLQRLAELLRRQRAVTVAARLALLYPMMLLVLAYAILVLVFAPLVTQPQTAIAIWPPRVVATGQWIVDQWYVPPLVGLLAGGLLWIGLRGPLSALHALLPGRYGRLSLFCRTLAMQIEAGTPQGQAVREAAAVSGDRRLMQAAGDLSARLERGEVAAGASQSTTTRRLDPLPPMLAWLLGQTPSLGSEATCLQLNVLARWYEQREAVHRRLWIRWVPGVLVALIGGGFICGYLLMAVRPIYDQLAGIG